MIRGDSLLYLGRKILFNHMLKKILHLELLTFAVVVSLGRVDGQSSDPSSNFLADEKYPEHVIDKIAFGSCNKPQRDQGFWEVIRAQGPDVMLLLGDNHYGNTSEPVRLKKVYDRLAAIPQYAAFRQQIVSLPTWDNHDYGDGYPGRLHPHGDESEQLFLDHFAVGQEDARRSRKGIYGAWIFGEEPHRVQVIMMDLQRFRDPFPEGKREVQFAPQKGKALMGQEQWEWFEKQLQLDAEVRLIGSGIQVLSNEHTWRRWGMFPDDRERLLRDLEETKGTTILLSGDRHRGEFSVLNAAAERPLFDLTSSSFNVCYPGEEKNSLRVGELIDEPHFGWLEIDWELGLVEMQLRSSKSGKALLTNQVKLSR